MPEVLIRQSGPFIQVTDDGASPTSYEVRQVLERKLSYTYLKFLYGADAYDEMTGQERRCRAEPRRLFTYDEEQRFVCQRGFRPKVQQLLQEAGYTVYYECIDPPKDPAIFEPDFDNVLKHFTFRPLQDVCLTQIAMHEYGVIDAVPAFGKSVVIPMITQMYPKAKIDIVSKQKSVIATLYDRLIRYTPHVGRVGGGKKKKKRITLYTADSLHHSDYNADIVLVDEIHELMPDRYAANLSRYWYSRIFGFTATKETRADNAHHRMEGICGPTIFYLDQQTAEHYGLVVPIIVQWLDIPLDYNPVAGYRSPTVRKKHGIWGNYVRNQTLATAARSFYEEGYQVLVSVDTVEHALHMKQFLPEFELCYGQDFHSDLNKLEQFRQAGILDPNMPPLTDYRRDELRRQFERGELRGAIATSIWRTGVSFDGLQVLVRAEGVGSDTASVQGPGRVCRTNVEGGKQVGIVIDADDSWDSGFRQAKNDRRRMYDKRGWTQYTGSGRLWVPRSRGGRGEL